MMIDPNFPLIDLHRHLDGNVRLETIISLGRKHNIALPAFELEKLRPYVQIVEPTPSVMAFIAKFKWMMAVLADLDACAQIAYENVEDAAQEGIDYIELRFSPQFMAESHQLDWVGVTAAVLDGVARGGRDFEIQTNVIGILSRTFGTAACQKELNALLHFKDQIAGLDLAGDERHFPAEWFEPHFKQGRDAGWQITVHAGEAAGAESIWQAIQKLGAQRIGHAVRAIDDPQVMDYLYTHQIGIEANLTSNLQTTTVPNLETHPVKTFFQRGLLVSLNTDDPGISGINLPHEYNIAAPQAGLTQTETFQSQRNALQTAFLSDADRQALIKRKR